MQPLTLEEIEALKKSGLHASVSRVPWARHGSHSYRKLQEIIKKQIEQHANYSLKTEYSKEKYKKRKEMKFVHPMSFSKRSNDRRSRHN